MIWEIAQGGVCAGNNPSEEGILPATVDEIEIEGYPSFFIIDFEAIVVVVELSRRIPEYLPFIVIDAQYQGSVEIADLRIDVIFEPVDVLVEVACGRQAKDVVGSIQEFRKVNEAETPVTELGDDHKIGGVDSELELAGGGQWHARFATVMGVFCDGCRGDCCFGYCRVCFGSCWGHFTAGHG